MAGVYALNMINQVALPFLASPIADDLQLSNTELGLLLGLSYAAVSALLSIPAAWVADRVSRSLVAGGGLALMGAASGLMGLGGSFGALLAGRALAGVGDSGIVAAAMSLVSTRAGPATRPAAIAIFNAGSGIGVIIAAIGLTQLAERVGW